MPLGVPSRGSSLILERKYSQYLLKALLNISNQMPLLKTYATAAELAAADKSKPYFPLAGQAEDVWSKDGEATATCFCGAVQLAFVSFVLYFASE